MGCLTQQAGNAAAGCRSVSLICLDISSSEAGHLKLEACGWWYSAPAVHWKIGLRVLSWNGGVYQKDAEQRGPAGQCLALLHLTPLRDASCQVMRCRMQGIRQTLAFKSYVELKPEFAGV